MKLFHAITRSEQMRLTFFAAALAFLLWGTPAFAQDDDGDGVGDDLDNCLGIHNAHQDDTDNDDCGNLCDADYNDTGTVDFLDFTKFVNVFGTNGNEEQCHHEPAPGCIVGFPDFAFMVNSYGKPPGSSGTTAGTTACP